VYHHFLSSIPNVPESIIRNLSEVEHFASDLFERQVKEMTLDIFFKTEKYYKAGYSRLFMTAGTCSTYLKAWVLLCFWKCNWCQNIKFILLVSCRECNSFPHKMFTFFGPLENFVTGIHRGYHLFLNCTLLIGEWNQLKAR
jgi:hypothetical protein